MYILVCIVYVFIYICIGICLVYALLYIIYILYKLTHEAYSTKISRYHMSLKLPSNIYKSYLVDCRSVVGP